MNSHLIDNMIFGLSMGELVRINVSLVPKLKKIFPTLTPSSGQSTRSIGCRFMGGVKNGSKFFKGKVGERVNAK